MGYVHKPAPRSLQQKMQERLLARLNQNHTLIELAKEWGVDSKTLRNLRDGRVTWAVARRLWPKMQVNAAERREAEVETMTEAPPVPVVSPTEPETATSHAMPRGLLVHQFDMKEPPPPTFGQVIDMITELPDDVRRRVIAYCAWQHALEEAGVGGTEALEDAVHLAYNLLAPDERELPNDTHNDFVHSERAVEVRKRLRTALRLP